MNANKKHKEDIAVTRNILFISYHQERYKEICCLLAGKYEISYCRIEERDNQPIQIGGNTVLCMVEMLRFTKKGEDLIHEIRNKTGIPILFLSGAKTERTRKEETVRAINSGVDGYLVSTQSAEEIAAKVIALIRLQQRIRERPEVWTCQDFQIILDRRQIFLKGQEILLTHLEFDIVHYLAMQNGRAVTYKELYEAVWHNEYLFDDESIMAHIHRIRLKMEADRKHPFYIQNVYGVGYRFGCCFTQE
jgi:DNA-binding response OmpR family regulator